MGAAIMPISRAANIIFPLSIDRFPAKKPPHRLNKLFLIYRPNSPRHNTNSSSLESVGPLPVHFPPSALRLGPPLPLAAHPIPKLSCTYHGSRGAAASQRLLQLRAGFLTPHCEAGQRLLIIFHLRLRIIRLQLIWEDRAMWKSVGSLITLICISSLLVPTFAGCSGSSSDTKPQAADSTAPAAGKKYRIAVIPKASTHEFWKSVHFGAQKAADELGNVEIIWNAPAHDDNREDQVSVVQNFTTKHVDGICLAPIDSGSLVSVVKQTKEAGIPVVIFDSGLEDPDLYVSYVATDNHHGGQLAAEEMGKRLGGKGKVILLRYSPGSESTENREKGFLDTVAKQFPDIKVLSSDQYAGTSEQSSLDKSESLLQKFGKDVNGIFAVNESSAAGMMKALVDAGLAGKVVYIGFDSSDRMVKALQDGNIQAIILQDPVNMGYQSVKAMVTHLKGEQVEKRIPTGEAIATKENMNEQKTHDLLNPQQY
ncbi:MAG TPA: substrate-binding domain-containing protein [Pirellulales bacterium]